MAKATCNLHKLVALCEKRWKMLGNNLFIYKW
jgi:hypothetical protein